MLRKAASSSSVSRPHVKSAVSIALSVMVDVYTFQGVVSSFSCPGVVPPMATTSIQQAALQFAKSLELMRSHLPGLPDPEIIKVVDVINGSRGAPATPPRDVNAPATLAEAVVVILGPAGQARRGDIRRAIESKGWAHLAGNKGLDGVLGRVLEGPAFERIHRGCYQLAKAVATPAAEPAWGEEAALAHARKLPQPFRSHQLAKSMGQGVFQVSAWLKVLRAKKLVKHAGTDVNGTHDWQVV
jgi:hypothetical protein